MLTSKATSEMINEWKNIYQIYKNKLTPNRKSGKAVKSYFCTKYQPEILEDAVLREVIKENILLNEANFEKLPQGKVPEIVIYIIKDKNILVGIDLVTGFYQVEGEEVEVVAEIYDDLFVFRGLDEKDLENYFLVAQYVQLQNMNKEY